MKKKQISNTEIGESHYGFFEAISLVKNAKEAKLFLLDLCTPAELQAMVDRWAVVDPIKKEKPYRKIHEDTGVSVTTIGRVARFINQGNDGYNIIYNRLKKRKHAAKKTKNSPSKKGQIKQ